MDNFAGLDVSVKETSVCIVDDAGNVVREVKVTSEPEALLAVLSNPAYRFKRALPAMIAGRSLSPAALAPPLCRARPSAPATH